MFRAGSKSFCHFLPIKLTGPGKKSLVFFITIIQRTDSNSKHGYCYCLESKPYLTRHSANIRLSTLNEGITNGIDLNVLMTLIRATKAIQAIAVRTEYSLSPYIERQYHLFIIYFSKVRSLQL